MDRWEYRVINTASIVSRWTRKGAERDIDQLQQQMNSLGQQGWEMIEFTTIPVTSTWSNKIVAYSYIAYFKRPLST